MSADVDSLSSNRRYTQELFLPDWWIINIGFGKKQFKNNQQPDYIGLINFKYFIADTQTRIFVETRVSEYGEMCVREA